MSSSVHMLGCRLPLKKGLVLDINVIVLGLFGVGDISVVKDGCEME